MEFGWFLVAIFVIFFLIFKKKKNSTTNKYMKISETRRFTDAQLSSGLNSSSRFNRSSNSNNSNRVNKQISREHSGIIEDDNLATFVIASEMPSEEKTKNNSPGRWVKPGESVTIKGHVINRGNFYYGGNLRAYTGFASSEYFYDSGVEASLVDDSFKIDIGTRNYEDQTLSYWPKYVTLSPRCRGAYINWLASDRSDPETPIGYVFIYFYGLERRIILDSPQGHISDKEFIELSEEIKRLRTVFVGSRSFQGYSTRLLETMSLLRPNVISVVEESSSGNSLLFKFQLASTVEQGLPIPPELALSWLKYYPEYTLRTPARRCDIEFNELFKQRYVKKFGDGIIVKPNKTKLKLEYSPASSTIRGIELEQKDLPDPSVLKAPIQKLTPIADSCTDALEAYSRYLGRKDSSKDDIAALMLLPDELITIHAGRVLSDFKIWADENIKNNTGLVHVAEFWSHLGMSVPEKINKKESEVIQNFAHKAGYGIAPDIRYHHTKPSPEGYIVLFEIGHSEFFEASTEFSSVAFSLRLGAMVAQTDMGVDESERLILQRLIDHNNVLSPTEKRSLHAYLIWQLNTPANMAGLKVKLEQLDDKEKSNVSNTLMNVAFADGKITPAEIKQLEKLYSALGLNSALVTSDIHNISATKKILPTPSLPKTLESSNGFTLNENILALHESETKDVRSLLNTIFVDDESDEKTQAVTIINPQRSDDLDEAHHQLYNSLLSKDKWARSEVIELCHKLNLMLNGAVETINNWSYEKVDAPVLDDDDDIYVDLEIVKELEE